MGKSQKEVGQGLVYLAANRKEGLFSLEAPVRARERNKGGWRRVTQ